MIFGIWKSLYCYIWKVYSAIYEKFILHTGKVYFAYPKSLYNTKYILRVKIRFVSNIRSVTKVTDKQNILFLFFLFGGINECSPIVKYVNIGPGSKNR